MKIADIPTQPHPFPWLIAEIEQNNCPESYQFLENESQGLAYSGGHLVYLNGSHWYPVAELNRRRNELVHIFNNQRWLQAVSNPNSVLCTESDPFWVPPPKQEPTFEIF